MQVEPFKAKVEFCINQILSKSLRSFLSTFFMVLTLWAFKLVFNNICNLKVLLLLFKSVFLTKACYFFQTKEKQRLLPLFLYSMPSKSSETARIHKSQAVNTLVSMFNIKSTPQFSISNTDTVYKNQSWG